MRVIQGDCLEQLKTLPDCSIDSLVTDPPAGISFMGKDWDCDKGGRDVWISWMASIMEECMRVLKPGAHGLVWALPRTSHWTATALEDAGFEVRDVVTHLFGSGFPKSMNVSIAIDKQAGARGARGKGFNTAGQNVQLNQNKELRSDHPDYVAPGGITDAAKKWQGFGTALKPASEHWILVRKPLSEKTVAANVLKWGCGALNIDASRIATEEELSYSKSLAKNVTWGKSGTGEQSPQGRFPANLVLSGDAVEMLDEQSGTLKSGQKKATHVRSKPKGNGKTMGAMTATPDEYPASEGGASRFFYCAKISKSERNAGCETGETRHMSTARLNSGDKSGKFPDHDTREKTGNHHPTVKPKKLMAYLIRMVTPPNGTVLDPFMGSGSTGIAAKECGFDFIGIEREPEYVAIAIKRIESAVVNA